MLWYKGWLETRFRLLFALGFMALFLVSAYSAGPKAQAGAKMVIVSATSVEVMLSVLLAGTGINTQPSLQASKGLHRSTLFILGLPVSRFRLPVVRAAPGWLEMAGAIGAMCCAMSTLFPVLREMTTLDDLLRHIVALIACASGLYCIPVLLAGLLDDQWRASASMIVFVPLYWLGLPTNRTAVPAFLNIFRARGESSPLVAHRMP